ncbi:MAG: HAMP domain-containing protein [Deltaproteobacteria bacterium]|nr:HAMP domain-containing protein [Deltaproteobacteria bacterium]
MSGEAPEPEARSRLALRVTVFFLVAAAPALVLTVAAVLLLDRLVAQEIAVRTQETVAEAHRILASERDRVAKAVAAVARDDAVRDLAAGVGQPGLQIDEGLALRLASAHGLDLLALVPLRGPQAGILVSSAHLPGAVGDDAPPFIQALLPAGTATVGAAHDWVEGNPPRLAPALLASQPAGPRRRPGLLVYGGSRLDGPQLGHVARAAQATFVLRSPGIRPVVFPADAPPGRQPRVLTVAAFPNGHALVDPGSAAQPDEPTRLEIYLHAERLERARSLLRAGAAALGGASLLAALVAGFFLSRRLTRPILELSDAARRVGAGDLTVTLEPRSDDEVGALTRVFNRMTSELATSRERLARAERLAAWQQIARRVAHEIKNPLFPIQMSIETLKKSYDKQHPKLDEIVEESTRTVLAEVRALNRIVTEFSDFARLPTLQRAPVAPRTVLAHVASLYAQPAGQVSLRPDLPEALPEILADREQLSRALINLVKNALEAAPEVTVTLGAEAGTHEGVAGVWLEVEDDGPGMPEEVKAQVFTPYFTTKAQGTGLGLAIVERITSEHGGAVDIRSAPGQGTTVALFIPQA